MVKTPHLLVVTAAAKEGIAKTKLWRWTTVGEVRQERLRPSIESSSPAQVYLI